MAGVFADGLADARRAGQETRFVLREALRLPAGLADVYLWMAQASGDGQMALSTPGASGNAGAPGGRAGWRPALLGGLPHGLMGLIIVLSTWTEGAVSVLGVWGGGLMLVAFGLILLGVTGYNLRRGWQPWSGTWIGYLGVVLFVGGAFLTQQLLRDSPAEGWAIPITSLMVMPLGLAYLLYRLAAADRWKGLSAAVPLTALVWAFFLEFVPTRSETLAWGWIFLLAFTATTFSLRTRRFGLALLLGLVIPAVGGLPFVYLGVYQGGTLPFSEPGPSLAEVMRQYVPFVTAVLSIPLGPQLARQARALGRKTGSSGGRVFYRMALGGVLLGLALALAKSMISMGNYGPRLDLVMKGMPYVALLAGALYATGAGWLAWCARKMQPARPFGLRLAGLLLALPGPALLLGFAPPVLSGHEVSAWVRAVEVAWVALAAWLAVDGPEL
jgi:hypothetical protein